MNLLEKNLKKYEKVTKGRLLPIEVALKHKADEQINKNIRNKIPSTHVSELNSIVKVISDEMKIKPERVLEGIMKSDVKDIIIVNTENTYWVKRNK
jgi:hypothetical protein